MQVLNLKNANSLYKGNKEVLKLYAGEKLLYKKIDENEYLMTYGKMVNADSYDGVDFYNPLNLSKVYYINTGFPVFSIAYMGNDIFALTNRYKSYIYIYKLNKDNNNFELKDTIKNYILYSTNNVDIVCSDFIQIVFYYNKNLYFASGYDNNIFSIIKINYDTINFNSRSATIAYKYSNDSIASNLIYDKDPSYYEGSFQIIDNYFLISDKNSKTISTFKILEDGNIERIGRSFFYSYDTAYLLNDGNILITNYKANSDSERIGLGLFKGDSILVKEIYKDKFSDCSPYSKTCYFNNKYYIIRSGYIYEYDNNLKTIKKINDDNYNYGFSIQISKDGIIYLLCKRGIHGYTMLSTLDENFSYQIKDKSIGTSSVIEPITL